MKTLVLHLVSSGGKKMLLFSCHIFGHRYQLMGVLKEVNLVGAYLQPPEHITVITSAESEMNDRGAEASHKPLKML